MPSPIRYPQGISTGAKGSSLFNMPYEDRTKNFIYANDFETYVAGHWTVTSVGAATQALLADEPFGALALTNAAADNDSTQIQLVSENFTLSVAKKFWYKARFKVSDATQSDFLIGLAVLDTTLLGAVDGDGVTDGIFFAKEDGDTNLDFYVQKDTTTGQTANAAIATVSTSYMTVGFENDGLGNIKFYVDDVHKGTATMSSTNMPDTPITVSAAMMNGEAVAKIMTIDYIVAAIER
jgi:hypothetical protein